MKRDLVSIADLSVAEVNYLLDSAADLKTRQKKGERHTPLAGKTLAMIFEKSSTRTRVSFEVAMFQLGGHALFLSSKEIQLGRGESIADTAKTLSRYVDAIMIRTFSHDDVRELAENADIPVINGLDDLMHPCQILADLFTIKEKKGSLKGLQVGYIGDSNNVAHSWLEGAAKTGMHLIIACPYKYQPQEDILKAAEKAARETGAKLEVIRGPAVASKNADVLYTDVWASMGQEAEQEERKELFKDYKIKMDYVTKLAKPGALVMHCLPMHRGEEIDPEVVDCPQSVIWEQAENRLHMQKAILVWLLTQ
jgi:ornithine carbamoyltransferase